MKLYKRVAKQRRNRAFRVRNRIRRSVSTHPRLSVFRSNKHIYAQLIDDVLGRTIVSASTREADFPGQTHGNKAAAEQVGKVLAQRAVEKGITQVSFDRGSYRYHGRVAALADAARAGGLQF